MAKVRNKKVSLEKTIKVVEQDLRNEQEKDSEAESLVQLMGSKVSEELRIIIMEMLLGFSKEMQREIADSLLDFAYEHIVRTTGCKSADTVLRSCYTWIAEEQGFKLKL